MSKIDDKRYSLKSLASINARAAEKPFKENWFLMQIFGKVGIVPSSKVTNRAKLADNLEKLFCSIDGMSAKELALLENMIADSMQE